MRVYFIIFMFKKLVRVFSLYEGSIVSADIECKLGFTKVYIVELL